MQRFKQESRSAADNIRRYLSEAWSEHGKQILCWSNGLISEVAAALQSNYA